MLEIEHCDWFILPLLLPTPTTQFSLDHKRRSHTRNECFASDSDSLIFTRSYRSALLITTPTLTPSLVKTSLNAATDKLYVTCNVSFIWVTHHFYIIYGRVMESAKMFKSW